MLRESRDWDDLVWAWKGWRDATGKHMRQDYSTYTTLLNKQATLSGSCEKKARNPAVDPGSPHTKT